MALIRDRSRPTAPLKMLLFGLCLIDLQANQVAGSAAAQFVIGFSLKKLLIQVPAGNAPRQNGRRLLCSPHHFLRSKHQCLGNENVAASVTGLGLHSANCITCLPVTALSVVSRNGSRTPATSR
jgi:hypothetical protein